MIQENNILISFSMPVRKHFDMTCKSIQSIVDNVSNIACIEVILRIDDDDNDMLPRFGELCQLFPNLIIKQYIGSKGNGWRDSHRFHTEACSIASGEFLQMWSDDALYMTKGFDDIIREKYSGKICVCSWKDTGNWTCFPMMSKQIYDIIQFGTTTFCDCYIVDIGILCDVYFYDESIYTMHDRFDLTQNNNHDEYNDQMNNHYLAAMMENNSVLIKKKKQEDSINIIKYLNDRI